MSHNNKRYLIIPLSYFTHFPEITIHRMNNSCVQF